MKWNPHVFTFIIIYIFKKYLKKFQHNLNSIIVQGLNSIQYHIKRQLGWQIVSLVTSSIKLPNGESLQVSFWNLVHNIIQEFYHDTYTYIQIHSIVGFFGSHGDCFSHSMVCIQSHICVFHWYPSVLEVLKIYVSTQMKICRCWHACVICLSC
jgi:hypothetical protein